VVFAYNDLGMHCMNQDFSELMILPPFNTLHAQVVDRREAPPRIVNGRLEVSYTVPGNTHSAGKTNFWRWAPTIFGVALPRNMGLTGNGLSGTMVPSGGQDWVASGIPLTPILDNGVEDPFQLATVTAEAPRGASATTHTVVPVSWEISCDLCHSGLPGTSVAGSILQAHDRLHGTKLVNHTPVACGTCHTQPELEPLGIVSDDPGNPTLSRAVHHAHALRVEALSNLPNKCYACHPGIRTQCLRDVHAARGMACVNCHGSMLDVADPARRPWTDEPRCGSCHNRLRSQYEQPATLYRNSRGHGGIYCEACHGSPHAITPTLTWRDNVQAIVLQGHAGKIDACWVCHGTRPTRPNFVHRFFVSSAAAGG
jgi:Cytochrome c554 and c-prime